MIFFGQNRNIVNAGRPTYRGPSCETVLWEKRSRAQKPFKHGGRTRDRTLDLSRVKVEVSEHPTAWCRWQRALPSTYNRCMKRNPVAQKEKPCRRLDGLVRQIRFSARGEISTFCNLFGFLRVHSVPWVIFPSIPNCRSNYRVHLVLINHEVPPVLSDFSSPAHEKSKRSFKNGRDVQPVNSISPSPPAPAAVVPTSSAKHLWHCVGSTRRSDCIEAGLS
jgi:hypothetical protein